MAIKPNLNTSQISAKILKQNKIKENFKLQSSLLSGKFSTSNIPKINLPNVSSSDPNINKTKDFLYLVTLSLEKFMEDNPEYPSEEKYTPKLGFIMFWNAYKDTLIGNYKKLFNSSYNSDYISTFNGKQIFDEYLEELLNFNSKIKGKVILKEKNINTTFTIDPSKVDLRSLYKNL